jgi:diacylglycerol O-acyltransferase / wax synthase
MGGVTPVGPEPLVAPWSPFNAEVSPHRVFEARRFALADVDRVTAGTAGATAADVALVVVGGALRRYLGSRKALAGPSLVASVERGATDAGSGGTPVSLQSDIDEPTARLEAIVAARRRAEDLGTVDRAAAGQIAEALPARLVGRAARAIGRGGGGGAPPPANTRVLHVLDEPTTVYAFGARVLTAFGMGPVASHIGLTHVVSRYGDYLTLSVTASRELLPDPASYADDLQASFDELLAAT